MKRIFKILFSLVLIFSITSTVEAATSRIYAKTNSTKYEYITDLSINYNTADGYNLYVLNIDTNYSSYTYLQEPVEADAGIYHIVNNSNVTGNSAKNYYIAQVAILWYQDYLNGTDTNIPATIKEYITSNSSDTVCYYINKLVNDAKVQKDNTPSITINTKDITFSRELTYFYSNKIKVTTNNLNAIPTLSLYNALYNTEIVNNDLKSDGTGTFQIKIPAAQLKNITEKDFVLDIKGKSNNKAVYIYSKDNDSKAVYGRVYTNTSKDVEASMPIKINGYIPTNIVIKLVNENNKNIEGIKFEIFRGDCSNSTCEQKNRAIEYITTTSYMTLSDVLNAGTYTIVRKTNSNKYNIQEKTVITVGETKDTQTMIIPAEIIKNNNQNNTDNQEENNTTDNRISIEIKNTLNDEKNIIYVYTNTGTLIESFKSSKSTKTIKVTEGSYYIIDSLNKIDELHFKITKDGKLMAKYYDDYKETEFIDLDKMKVGNNVSDKNDSTTSDTTTNNSSSSSTTTTVGGITIENKVDVDVKVDWTSDIVDCPITSVSSTMKYIFGAIILALGTYLVIRNVKKHKNNN